MRIALDGTFLQRDDAPGEARATIKALVGALAGRGGIELFVILDARRRMSIAPIRQELAGTVAAERIRLFHAPAPEAAAALMREALLADLRAEIVLRPGIEEAQGRLAAAGLFEIPTVALAWRAGAFRAHLPPACGGPHGKALELPPAPQDAADALLAACLQLPRHPPKRRPGRPKLAYVSPLPPERSGISYYSAELLPALAAHYDIELVAQHPHWPRRRLPLGLPVRSVAWFRANAGRYDRVVYQFGNSKYHRHMFSLLAQHPGVVVLHDFFLSGIVADMDRASPPGAWARELYRSHGYAAVRDRFQNPNGADVVWRYPCSGTVLSQATGVIVHSQHGRELARAWYGERTARRMQIVPHMRAVPLRIDRSGARRALGMADDAFLVCAFGGLGPTKLNHRLVSAWLQSSLAGDEKCRLVFVGENHGRDYAKLLAGLMRDDAAARIAITGWADEQKFRLYLQAADVAVQLRALSRGESSGTVLDCMAHGLPLVVNAHGSMAGLPAHAVTMLPDCFEERDLVEALETLWRDDARRAALARSARAHIGRHHDPVAVAASYARLIEGIAAGPDAALARLPALLAKTAPGVAGERLRADIAATVAPSTASRQLFVDVSAIARADLRTGIERAVRALVAEFLKNPPQGWRIEPVRCIDTTFHAARRFTLRLMGIDSDALVDEPIVPRAGDVYFMPDLDHAAVIRNRDTYRALREQGVGVNFLVHDLLPVRLPQFFPPAAETMHENWLRVVAEADRAVCVSRAVADDLDAWLDGHVAPAARRPQIRVSHHGFDLHASRPSRGLPAHAAKVLNSLSAGRAFLMVGTVEPRKGHAQVLDGFERLWAEGSHDRLAIVGKSGWMNGDLIERLKRHPERGRRLFWIKDASDEYLERLYAASTCLIAASFGEGFGLPLIEAAAQGLHVLARDIPVFREVAGAHASFFAADSGAAMAQAVKNWIAARPGAPSPTGMARLSWAGSAANLLRILVPDSA